LEAIEVHDNRGRKHKLVKLRNPWGKFEWTGAWGDESKEWTPELKSKCNWTAEDDGTFFMCWADLKRYFTNLQTCHINKDYFHSSIRCEHPNESYSCVRFEVPSHGKVNISCLQKDKRIPNKNPNYDYACVRGTVVKIIDETPGQVPEWQAIKGCFDFPKRDVWLTFEDMEPGSYFFVVELVHMNQNYGSRSGHENFVVSTYSSMDVVLVAD
jgi:hypothetical protein